MVPTVATVGLGHKHRKLLSNQLKKGPGEPGAGGLGTGMVSKNRDPI